MGKIINLNEKYSVYNNISNIKALKLDKYRMVIVGEKHGSNMISIYEYLLKKYNFDYFIAEFAYDDDCLTREDAKYKMDHATNGGMGPCDYQYNYWLYELAYKYDIPLIGCDRKSAKGAKSMEEEFKIRETSMLNTISQYYSKGKCLVQLGDGHLRSIPIDEDYILMYGTDERGLYDDNDLSTQTISFASPIFKKYVNDPNTMIFRLKSEYDEEQNYINKK